MSGEMILDTTEFLLALSRLKPIAPRRRSSTRPKKSNIDEDLYISYLYEEAIFSARGVQTKCVVEKARWHGYVTVNIGTVLSFLKVKPKNKTVTLSFALNKFKIETLTIPCKWAPVPDWIGAMSTEALFHDDGTYDDGINKKLNRAFFCPNCGKRQSDQIAVKRPIQLELGAKKLPKVLANRICKACKYEWHEIIKEDY